MMNLNKERKHYSRKNYSRIAMRQIIIKKLVQGKAYLMAFSRQIKIVLVQILVIKKQKIYFSKIIKLIKRK